MANSAWDWSTTAASNNSATPYGWPENQDASTVNDCARQMMATLTEAIHSTTAGGTADALTVTLANAPAALTDGMEILVRAAAANTTTTPTLNLNSLGTKTITKLGGTALVAGDIAGNLHELDLRYNLANTRWELLNPAPSSATVPSGTVSPYAGSSAPSGWLLCYGQAVSRTTYAALFGVISTTYGTGDGSTTFNLPDLRGRAVFGVDNMGGTTASRMTNAVSGITGTTLGAAGGDQNSAQHTHTISVTDPGHVHGPAGDGSGFVMSTGGSSPGGSTGIHNVVSDTASATTGITASAANAGSGVAGNVPPAMMLNYIIKT